MPGLTRRSALRLVLLVAASPLVTAIPSIAAENAALAIKGYDPVAYFTARKADARAAGVRI